MTIALRAGDRGLSFLAHSSPGNGLLACKKRMGISASSSLGCARDDETGKGISPISFQPIAEANLRPFGAPPSIGRRECPREPLPLEGAAERSEAGLASFFAAKPPALSLPPWGRGTASAVDRVLSLMAHLRRSPPLSFIPLVPYPARSARHLPLEGKALFRKYRYPHPTSAPSGHLLPEEGGRMPASPIANPFPASSSRNLPLFCGTI